MPLLFAPLLWLVVDEPSARGLHPDGADHPPAAAAFAMRDPGFRSVAANPATWLIAICFALAFTANGGMVVQIYAHAGDLGLDRTAMGLAPAAMAAGGMLGKPAYGWLADRWGTRPSLVIALGLMILGLALFLRAADADEYAALWRLALLTGLRRGELLGLKWEDLDLEKRRLSVRRTYSRAADGNWALGTPKTRGGRRAVALPLSAVDALRAHRRQQAELRLQVGGAYHDQGFVFATPEGKPLHVNSLLGRFKKLVREAGVPALRFHDLRHTAATLMLAEGTADLKRVVCVIAQFVSCPP